MGDRANIHVKCRESEGVYLYTHWSGTELPVILQDALARRERWNDPQYLARIIFCEMVQGDVRRSTGYGITSQVHDGYHRIIEVDPDKQTVEIEGEVWTFDEYLEADLSNIW